MTLRQTWRGRRDAGFTLVEVMVSIALFSVLMALLSGVVIEMLKANAGTRDRLANLDQVRGGMDAMTRTLRTAVRPEQLNPGCVDVCDYAFEAIGPTAVTFFANVGETAAGADAPTRITYTVTPDAGGKTATVTEVRQKVDPSWASGDYVFVAPCTVAGPAVAGCTARAVTAGIRWPYPAGEQPFAFRSVDGGTDLAAGTNVTTVATAEVTLPLGTADNPSQSVTSTVFLPNTSLGR
jgi:prepilin-type N-terminal cleavage/methylation domain-containing protein